jgi:hypothetical protein
MADWLLADYVEDTGLEPGWTPPITMVGGSVVTAVRDWNVKKGRRLSLGMTAGPGDRLA